MVLVRHILTANFSYLVTDVTVATLWCWVRAPGPPGPAPLSQERYIMILIEPEDCIGFREVPNNLSLRNRLDMHYHPFYALRSCGPRNAPPLSRSS